MADTTISVSPGNDLYRLAAQIYGDPEAWTLLARANNLLDPLITADLTLVVPAYNAGRANSGILASQ